MFADDLLKISPQEIPIGLAEKNDFASQAGDHATVADVIKPPS
jgi:hypothetical protein